MSGSTASATAPNPWGRPVGTTCSTTSFAFIEPRFGHAHRVLTDRGSLLVHLDYREVHYCKVALDRIFGRDCFQNEIIWAYDYGARTRKRWAAKHDTILWYTKDPEIYTYDYDAIDRIPYMAPRLAGAEKAKRGKTPTDVWWHTIVSPSGKEKTGYATQKPRGILDRIIRVHSKVGDLVLDFFAGSGTTGEAAAEHGRDFVLVDNNPEAIDIMTKRLARFAPVRSPDARTASTSDSTGRRDHNRRNRNKIERPVRPRLRREHRGHDSGKPR